MWGKRCSSNSPEAVPSLRPHGGHGALCKVKVNVCVDGLMFTVDTVPRSAIGVQHLPLNEFKKLDIINRN